MQLKTTKKNKQTKCQFPFMHTTINTNANCDQTLIIIHTATNIQNNCKHKQSWKDHHRRCPIWIISWRNPAAQQILRTPLHQPSRSIWWVGYWFWEKKCKKFIFYTFFIHFQFNFLQFIHIFTWLETSYNHNASKQ